MRVWRLLVLTNYKKNLSNFFFKLLQIKIKIKMMEDYKITISMKYIITLSIISIGYNLKVNRWVWGFRVFGWWCDIRIYRYMDIEQH